MVPALLHPRRSAHPQDAHARDGEDRVHALLQEQQWRLGRQRLLIASAVIQIDSVRAVVVLDDNIALRVNSFNRVRPSWRLFRWLNDWRLD